MGEKYVAAPAEAWSCSFSNSFGKLYILQRLFYIRCGALEKNVEESVRTQDTPDPEHDLEVAFILQQAEAASRKTTYQWVV